jgi:hypothetical protein
MVLQGAELWRLALRGTVSGGCGIAHSPQNLKPIPSKQALTRLDEAARRSGTPE